MRTAYKIYFFLLLCWFVPNLYAQTQTVDLIVAYKKVNYTGKTVTAIAVNGQIPGPVLHFHEGDDVIIRVHSHLKVGTTIHWHGVLVPWRMDGVAYITQDPIAPQQEFDYKFKIKQSGTYWYHAHADLQEQLGLYGAIIIDPKQPSPYHYDKDFPIVLSDWSNENPETIYKRLRESGNMPAMNMGMADLSDVKYDVFLLNGTTPHKPWQQSVKVGDTIRLRLIGAGASTEFKIKVDDAPLTVVEVQGNDVKPFVVKDLSLAPGQTVDVLVTIKDNKPYTIYAESLDASGYALGILNPTQSKIVTIPAITPFAAPKPMAMSMPAAKDESAQWQALTPTNDPNKPVKVIRMRLGGSMEHYKWFINGVPESLAKPILIKPGQRYRLVFINETMMYHPMHLHGHWLILRNGHGAYDPLVHTVDVAPLQTVTVDFDADAGSGWWYLHCHNLYHMMAGMARVMHYDVPDDNAPIKKSESAAVTSQSLSQHNRK